MEHKKNAFVVLIRGAVSGSVKKVMKTAI